MFDVYKHYNISLLSYSEASENANFLKTINRLREKQVDAFCYKSDKSYIVFYDNMAYPNRIPFTLAHELGHILLRHHYCSDYGIITRYATLARKLTNAFCPMPSCLAVSRKLVNRFLSTSSSK
ncbi:ImmA/IrrE family metallo-endopeptidase [Dialister invisus]|uniref:ImmA/IrrE family metallo-endopeptidase n=1 Tax=Dialister invisus TaxID=218538 RepID=UPI003C6C4E7F